jgi:RNA polymerase subunit RPABC4/transcription elongation factor Spt4
MWGVLLTPAVLLVVWILLSILATRIAERKGRSGAIYFLVSFFLTPVVGLLMAAIAKPRQAAASQRRCPFCAELLKREAKGCRFCGKHLPEVESPQDQSEGQRFEGRSEYEAWKAAIAELGRARSDELRLAAGNQRGCPYCAELVKREAKGCRFCGKHLPEV